MKRAVILLSGGLDSATTLYLAKKREFKCFCLIFDYGQRHKKEINCAKKIAKYSKTHFKVIKISLPWGGSALLDKRIKVPTSRNKNIPNTYVPARNTIFLSFALSYTEAIGADAMFIGANAVDYSGYPDCRPNFYKAFEKVIKRGTKAGAEGKSIKIFTPLIHQTKAEIIKLGTKLGVPYDLTWSCYKGSEVPCGACDSCRFRAKGFREAEIDDPLLSFGEGFRCWKR